MIKYKTRKNYRKLYLNMKGYLIISIIFSTFLGGLTYWFAKGNIALRQELVDNSNIRVTIR